MTEYLNPLFQSFIENILYRNFIDNDFSFDTSWQSDTDNNQNEDIENDGFWSVDIFDGITILLNKLIVDLSDEFQKKRGADSDFHRYLIVKKLRATFNTEISDLLNPLENSLDKTTKLLISLSTIAYQITLLEIYNLLLEGQVFELETEFDKINKIETEDSKDIINIINSIHYKIDLLKFKIILRSKHNSNLNKEFNTEKVSQIQIYLESINKDLANSKIVRKIIGHYLDLENQIWCEAEIHDYGTCEIKKENNSFMDLHNRCKNIKENKSLNKKTKILELEKLHSLIPNNRDDNNYFIFKKLQLYIANNKFSVELSDIKVAKYTNIQEIIDKTRIAFQFIKEANKSLKVNNYFHHYKYSKFLFEIIEFLNSHKDNNIDIQPLIDECVTSIIDAKESVVWMKENAFNILTIPSDESNFNVGGLDINFFNGYIIPQDYDWILRYEIEPLISKIALLELQFKNIRKFSGIEESVEKTKNEINASTVRNVEILSIFGALSYFVTSSVSIFNSDKITIPQHLCYIMIMGGILLLFISLTKAIVSESWKENKPLKWVFGISIGLLALPLVFLFLNQIYSTEKSSETTTTIKEEYKSEKKTELSVPAKTLPDTAK